METNQTKGLSPEEIRILEEKIRLQQPIESVASISDKYQQNLNGRKTSEETLKVLITYLGFYLPLSETDAQRLYFETIMKYLEMKKELFWRDIPSVKMALTTVQMKYKDSHTVIEKMGNGAREDLSAYYLEKVAEIDNLLQII